MTFIRLTTSGHGWPSNEAGLALLVHVPFDHAEQREGYTYIRTGDGAHLYVAESLTDIEALVEAAAAATADTHLHHVVRRADGSSGVCCQ